jgi:hypothetical protein
LVAEWTPELETFMGEFVSRVAAQGLRGSTEVLDGVKGQAGKAIADAAA